MLAASILAIEHCCVGIYLSVRTAFRRRQQQRSSAVDDIDTLHFGADFVFREIGCPTPPTDHEVGHVFFVRKIIEGPDVFGMKSSSTQSGNTPGRACAHSTPGAEESPVRGLLFTPLYSFVFRCMYVCVRHISRRAFAHVLEARISDPQRVLGMASGLTNVLCLYPVFHAFRYTLRTAWTMATDSGSECWPCPTATPPRSATASTASGQERERERERQRQTLRRSEPPQR